MTITTITNDLAKEVFQMHSMDMHGKAVLRNKNVAAIALANTNARIIWAFLPKTLYSTPITLRQHPLPQPDQGS